MSNEKMREDFEAWTRRRFNGLSLLRINLPGSPADGQYEVIATHECWDAWQASRAAVVVQLPYVRSYPIQEASSDVDWYLDEGRHEMKLLCRDAIEAAGLKVQP